jgi:putative transposase
MDSAHEGHNVHLVVYHIIWCPKRRRKVLVGPIRSRLEQIVREVAAENDWTVIELAIQPDHVHLFIRADPNTLPSDIPRRIKGRSSHHLRREFPPLRKVPSMWTRSFFLSTAGNVSQETIRKYIERQSKTEMDEQTVRKTFKFKLKPTPDQERAMEFVLRRCRGLYNAALQERRDAWQKGGVSVTVAGQSAQLREVNEVRTEYQSVHSQVLQDVLTRLDRAFQAFFRRVKNGETPGYPRFQGANRYNSCTYKQFGNGATLDNGFLVLSKIGRVAVRGSPPLEGTPKTVTLSREADGWYVCFSCADVPIQPLPATGQETGIDLGLEAFATTSTASTGERILHPGWYRNAERALKTAQRRVSRRKKGSHRRRKAVVLLAKAHLKVKRQRADFHHKTALRLVQTNDTMYHEDLQTANMVKNHHLAKSISDAGWSQFLSILSHKAAWAGSRVVGVPPAYTSQTCSGCGVIVAKGVSVRWHSCPDCGTSLHRDHNAARTIERAGLALRGAVA